MIPELLVPARPRTWLHHYTALHGPTAVLLVLFLLFAVLNGLFLHRVPGLMGDEGSEGVNVYELRDAKTIVLHGERSYIGPWIDYVRVPFVLLLGASPLALRLPMFLASLALFWIAWALLQRWFGAAALPSLAALVFSPAYLSHLRFGWAISLLPLFALSTIALASSRRPSAPLLAGLVAGLGLSTHLLFLPTLASLVALLVASRLRRPTSLLRFWPSLIGFWAGFGTQFVILRLFRDDQGNPAGVLAATADRLQDLPRVLPLVLSGSPYIAHYTGQEFPSWLVSAITGTLAVFVGCALALRIRDARTWLWCGALLVHLLALTAIAEYFSLRYFVVFVLGVWALAGLGLGTLLARVGGRRAASLGALVLAGTLSVGFLALVLVPFLFTGGSTRTFSLGNRRDEASALVNTVPLQRCLAGAGPVFSENIHIRNRIEFLAHGDQGFTLARRGKEAAWIVTYRTEKTPPRTDERCPDLKHFRVVPVQSRHAPDIGPSGDS